MVTYVSYHDMLAHTEGLVDGPLEKNYSAIFDKRRRLQNPVATQKINKSDILVTFTPVARPRLAWAPANPSNARHDIGRR